MKKKKERDKKGRFTKGHKGGPGRPKGEPRDIICKDGKKRSVDVLIDDLLATYGTLGGSSFLKKWALQSHSNLRKFVDILFKFAPQPDIVAGDVNIKVISATPRIDDSAAAKRIRELEAELEEKDKELSRFRARNDVHDIKEIQHEPIRVALPEHVKEAKKMRAGDASFRKWKREREEFTERCKKGYEPDPGELANMIDGLTSDGYDKNGKKVSFAEKGKDVSGSDNGIGGKGVRISK